MNNLFLIALVSLFSFSTGCSGEEHNVEEIQEPVISSEIKCLTVYYSWSGNSKTLASDIYKLVGGDLVEVTPTTAYTADYNQMLDVAPREIREIDNNGIYPSINNSIDSFEKYDFIFICTPLWWSRMSTPMQSFLHNHSSKLSGKSIAMVVTSQSSAISGVIADAKRLCPNSTFVENSLWITSSQVGNSHNRIVSWLETMGVISIN